MFHYTVSTEKDTETALESLVGALAEKNFGVLWKLDFKEKLAEKGLDFNGKFIILEVCNPVKAKEALEGSVLAGYFLPCKIVVYEQNGQTKIGTVRPSALMDMIEGGFPSELPLAVEKILIDVINAAK